MMCKLKNNIWLLSRISLQLSKLGCNVDVRVAWENTGENTKTLAREQVKAALTVV
jgi:hypothetical protein